MLAALCLWVLPVHAQVPEDAMEAQRCIWRCLAEYGASDPRYPACVSANCDEGPVAAAPLPPAPGLLAPGLLPPDPMVAALPPGPGVLAGVWRYAAHPALGPTAHIQTAAGTLGIGCGVNGAGLGLRVQDSLFAGARLTWITEPGRSASTLLRLQGAWSGVDGDACDVPVAALAESQALYLVPAGIEALSQTAAGNQITLSDGTRAARVITGPQALAAFGGYVVPLTGAHAALSALLAACPAARQAAINGCGDD